MKRARAIYLGISEECGTLYSFKRSGDTPHLHFFSLNEGFVGWYPDRHRFIVNGKNTFGLRNIGWRKKVYG